MNTNTGNLWRRVIISIVVLCLALGYLLLQVHNDSQAPQVELSPTPIVEKSGNMILISPVADERVSQDFRIIGKARVFENVVSIRLKNKLTDYVYLEDRTMTDATEAGVLGNFSYTVHLINLPTLKSGDTLLLEVYEVSPKDGSEINKIVIPLHFSPALND